jgi:hypothetical protein
MFNTRTQIAQLLSIFSEQSGIPIQSLVSLIIQYRGDGLMHAPLQKQVHSPSDFWTFKNSITTTTPMTRIDFAPKYVRIRSLSAETGAWFSTVFYGVGEHIRGVRNVRLTSTGFACVSNTHGFIRFDFDEKTNAVSFDCTPVEGKPESAGVRLTVPYLSQDGKTRYEFSTGTGSFTRNGVLSGWMFICSIERSDVVDVLVTRDETTAYISTNKALYVFNLRTSESLVETDRLGYRLVGELSDGAVVAQSSLRDDVRLMLPTEPFEYLRELSVNECYPDGFSHEHLREHLHVNSEPGNDVAALSTDGRVMYTWDGRDSYEIRSLPP